MAQSLQIILTTTNSKRVKNKRDKYKGFEIMENTGYIALSRQIALGQEMTTIANNIANMNTTGYKSQHTLFTQELLGAGDDTQKLRAVMDYGQFANLEQGPLRQTGNTFDFALQGSGYFAVEHNKTGETFYTRAGNLTLNDDRQLATAAGHLILGKGDAPISIPEGSTNIIVGTEGSITSDQGAIGQFQLVEFENEFDLNLSGDGLLSTAQQPRAPETTTIHQGMVEGSNVQAVVEMTRMIDISRNYQMNQKILQNEHDRIRNAINKISQSVR